MRAKDEGLRGMADFFGCSTARLTAALGCIGLAALLLLLWIGSSIVTRSSGLPTSVTDVVREILFRTLLAGLILGAAWLLRRQEENSAAFGEPILTVGGPITWKDTLKGYLLRVLFAATIASLPGLAVLAVLFEI
jgi:hypothetical protein